MVRNPLHGVESPSVSHLCNFLPSNPLHGVERYINPWVFIEAIAYRMNPLHGVERDLLTPWYIPRNLARRIHYMELKGGGDVLIHVHPRSESITWS